jgi:preprotein translocase subunit YajC
MEQPFLVAPLSGAGERPQAGFAVQKMPAGGPVGGPFDGRMARIAIGRAASIFRAPSRRATFRDRLAVPPRRTGKMGGGDLMTNLGGLLPFILIFVIMYFLILRPQQKRAKQHQEMVKNLRRGDNVITSGGLVGKVTKVVDDDQVEIEIADGVRVRQVKSMIADVRVKGEPVKDEAAS